MAAVAPGRQLNIRLSLLKDTHHGVIAFDAADRLCYNAAALITDEKQFYAAAFQLLYDFRRAVAAPLFCAGGCQIDITRRYVILR